MPKARKQLENESEFDPKEWVSWSLHEKLLDKIPVLAPPLKDKDLDEKQKLV